MQMIVTVIIVVVMVYIFMFDGNLGKLGNKINKSSIKDTNTENKNNSDSGKNKSKNIKQTQTSLPFKTIKSSGKATDPALILKDENTFIGGVEVYGINYNLLSIREKQTLEEVFQRTLNGLDYPIQIYVQSRKIDLDNYKSLYEKRLSEVKDMMEIEQNRLDLLITNKSDPSEIETTKLNLNRINSQFIYGTNVMRFINQFSYNEDILDKRYFILTPYYYDSSQFNVNQTDDEKFAIAYNTIVTRLNSVLSGLSGSALEGKLLNGIEMAELLYTSYNKPDSDKYKLNNAMRSNFSNYIVTSRPVEFKILDEEKKKIKEQYEKELKAIS